MADSNSSSPEVRPGFRSEFKPAPVYSGSIEQGKPERE